MLGFDALSVGPLSELADGDVTIILSGVGAVGSIGTLEVVADAGLDGVGGTYIELPPQQVPVRLVTRMFGVILPANIIHSNIRIAGRVASQPAVIAARGPETGQIACSSLIAVNVVPFVDRGSLVARIEPETQSKAVSFGICSAVPFITTVRMDAIMEKDIPVEASMLGKVAVDDPQMKEFIEMLEAA